MFDRENKGMGLSFYKPNFNCDNWETVSIEKFWSEYKGGEKEYRGNAWYKKNINVSKELLNNTSLFIYFKGIDEEATVYVNGELAYEHTEKATGKKTNILWDEPFYFNAKTLLKEGDNDITVVVGNPNGLAGGIYKGIYFLYSDLDLSNVPKNYINMAFSSTKDNEKKNE